MNELESTAFSEPIPQSERKTGDRCTQVLIQPVQRAEPKMSPSKSESAKSGPQEPFIQTPRAPPKQKKSNSDSEILRKHTVVEIQKQEEVDGEGHKVTVTTVRRVVKFETKGQRKRFVQIVFALVTAMLVVCMFAGALPFLHPPIRLFFAQHTWLFYVSAAVFSILYLLIVCIRPVRQKQPYNYITLVVFTLVTAFLVMCLCSSYNLKTIGIGLLATVVATVAIILYATFTKTDFTTCWALVFGLSMIMLVFGTVVVISQFFLPPHTFEILHLVFSCIGAVIALVYLTFDVQLIMGRKKNAIAPDEYVLGAILMFTDIFVLFTYATGIAGGAENV